MCAFLSCVKLFPFYSLSVLIFELALLIHKFAIHIISDIIVFCVYTSLVSQVIDLETKKTQ